MQKRFAIIGIKSLACLLPLFSALFAYETIWVSNSQKQPEKRRLISGGISYGGPSTYHYSAFQGDHVTINYPQIDFSYGGLTRKSNEISFSLSYLGFRTIATNSYPTYWETGVMIDSNSQDTIENYLRVSIAYRKMFNFYPLKVFVGGSIGILSLGVISQDDFSVTLTTNASVLSRNPSHNEPTINKGIRVYPVLLDCLQLNFGLLYYLRSNLSIEMTLANITFSRPYQYSDINLANPPDFAITLLGRTLQNASAGMAILGARVNFYY